MTKAERFLASIQPVGDLTDADLLSKARAASGPEPETFVNPTTGEPREFDFRFDDDSILNVDIISPGVRHIAVKVLRK
jgi:hypothetical protein